MQLSSRCLLHTCKEATTATVYTSPATFHSRARAALESASSQSHLQLDRRDKCTLLVAILTQKDLFMTTRPGTCSMTYTHGRPSPNEVTRPFVACRQGSTAESKTSHSVMSDTLFPNVLKFIRSPSTSDERLRPVRCPRLLDWRKH